jgi:hypothetical protein
MLDKNEAEDREFFLTHEYIAGDKALNEWLDEIYIMWKGKHKQWKNSRKLQNSQLKCGVKT